MTKEYVMKSNCPKVTMLRSVEVAIDEEGWFYELERQGNGYRALLHHEPMGNIADAVVEWFDALDNYDLMVLTMWCIDNNLKLPYNFR
mgnify:FL=1